MTDHAHIDLSERPEPLLLVWPVPGNPAALVQFDTAADWRGFIDGLAIDARIPQIVRAKWGRAQTLYLLGWIDFSLIKAGELAALIALELALVDRYGGLIPTRKRSFATLLTYMVEADGLTDADIPVIVRCGGTAIGHLTGAHRTWLDPGGFNEATLGKAPVETPRRAMGNLLGSAVRFGLPGSVIAAGEGVETMLSLRCVLPTMPMAAALSAAHLAAIQFPDTLHRLYVARDDDPAGDAAMTTLMTRADEAGIETLILSPTLGDFNEDLRLLGLAALRAAIRVQIAPQDVARFMEHAA